MADIYAASASYSDVAAAVASAVSGDRVFIPSGNATWASTLTITLAIQLIGSGKSGASGKITHNVGTVTPLIDIALTSGEKAKNVRISGIYFENTVYCPSAGANQYTWDILISNEATSFRVDNCTFHYGKEAVTTGISQRHNGVIDSCYFDDVDLGIRAQDDAAGTGSWDRTIQAGSTNSDCVFIEDNTFFYSNAGSSASMNEPVYHSNAARSTVRHNTFTANDTFSNFIDAHGLPGCDRGTVLSEIYSNTFTCTTVDRWCYLRGGSFVVHDNIITTTSGSARMVITNELAWPAYGSDPAWPSDDQLNNCFFWNNTVNGSASAIDLNNSPYDDPFLVVDRDYFLHAPAASGGRESYPTTAGNDDMTFSSSGANAYYPYTEYAYPHPLRAGDVIAKPTYYL